MPETDADSPTPGGAHDGATEAVANPTGNATADSSLLEVSPGRIAVGRINGVWGLKGHVKVFPLSTNPERLKAGSVVIVKDRPTTILEVVEPQGYPIVLFQGYTSRTAAERLRDTLIEIDEADLPSLADDEFYVDDLVGLEVVTTEDVPVGRLTEVLTTGANDVYVVARPGQRDVLVPAIGDVVISVDLDAGRMVIDAVPGLLD